MGAYLSIVSGAIRLFNYLAAALQQHHDEMNGRRAQVVDDLTASNQAASEARKDEDSVSRLSDQQLNDELRGTTSRK